MKLLKSLLTLVLIACLVGGFLMWRNYQASDGIILSFSEAQIEEQLAEEFPKTTTIEGIIPVEVKLPRIEFIPDTDRVRCTLVAEVDALIRKYDASATLSCALRYEPEDQSLRLVDAVIENFDTDQIPENYRERVAQAASLLAKKYLNEQPVYHLKKADLKATAARYLLKEVTVADGLLKVRLGL